LFTFFLIGNSEIEGQAGPSAQYLCATPDWFKYSEIIYERVS